MNVPAPPSNMKVEKTYYGLMEKTIIPILMAWDKPRMVPYLDVLFSLA
jgi:hypothetical protein